jgi:hypothetical protein
MNVTTDDLFLIIGMKEVELFATRKLLEQLEAEKRTADPPKENPPCTSN